MRQGHIEARPKVGNARLRLLVPRLRRIQRLLNRRKLTAQRSNLLVENIDLRGGTGGDIALGIEGLLAFGKAAVHSGRIIRTRIQQSLKMLFFLDIFVERGADTGQIVLGVIFQHPFQRQELRQFINLLVEPA